MGASLRPLPARVCESIHARRDPRIHLQNGYDFLKCPSAVTPRWRNACDPPLSGVGLRAFELAGFGFGQRGGFNA